MPPHASHLRVPMIRIVVVEPYALVRASLTEIMGAEPDFDVVGEVPASLRSALLTWLLTDLLDLTQGPVGLPG
jgi:DNA-binding NarL/FixJ family response regulator